MPTHTTLEGHEIRFDEPTGDLAAFVAAVRAAAADPAVTENDLVALIYGPTNPLLDHT
ncbi:MAG: DNA-binding protein, partial [Myxococcaceae bacterium]